MFDFVYNNKRVIQFVLAIIFLPFAFFGVDSYFHSGGESTAVATVGDYHITEQEFNQALRERQEAIQRVAGGRADPGLLDSPELRFSVLEGLIRQHLLLNRALRSGVTVSDAQLRNVISELPLFQEGGKFSMPRYEQFLKSQGMTPAMFEARFRHDLLLQQVDDSFGGTSFSPHTVVERIARLSAQQREVSLAVIAPDKFESQVKLGADAAKKYYDGHQEEFRIPEQVRVEYVALTQDSLLPQIQIDPAEVKKYYEEHKAQYQTPEERRASHILISVEPGASAEAKQKARAKAEEIYRQLKQKPDRFAELAKQYSQDPGSAAHGGDLGFFGRGGAMPKPFEDAVFKMKTGEISAPVETQYGFHIIRLDAVKGGGGRSFDEVRGQIETDLKRQRAGRKFSAVAENFSNVVFEQSDSLKPAADLVKASTRQSGWITRSHADDPQLNNPKLLQAIFSEDTLKNKRNTEAVEVAPGVLVAARVIDHKPAAVQPFAEVSAAIVKKLARQQAGQLALQDGREQLEKLKQGKEVRVEWGAAQLLSRSESKGVSEPVLKQIFRAGTAKLPAYAGVENPQGGYTLIRITRVVGPDKIAANKEKTLAGNLRQMLGQQEMLAYIASLKQKAEITINKELVEKKEQQ